MTQYFHVFIDEEDKGPFTIGALRSMQIGGKISEETPVRLATDEHWSTLREMESGYEKEIQASPPKVTTLQSIRLDIRQATGYSTLRQCFSVLMWLNVVAAILFILLAFGEEAHWTYAILAATSFLALIPLCLAGAILDMADCALNDVRLAQLKK